MIAGFCELAKPWGTAGKRCPTGRILILAKFLTLALLAREKSHDVDSHPNERRGCARRTGDFANWPRASFAGAKVFFTEESGGSTRRLFGPAGYACHHSQGGGG